MLKLVRHYLLALQFFTRIPITGALAQWVGFSPQMLRASVAHFPGIGWLVGAISALAFLAIHQSLPVSNATAFVAAALGTAASVWLTGGFHEDGLADMVDGLGGSPDRARALEIMKDSRVGSFGVLALVLVLLAKVTLLALLGDIHVALACAALFAGHAVSRTYPLFIIMALPHVGDEGASKAKPLADSVGLAQMLIGLAWCLGALLIASIVLQPLALLLGVALSALAYLYMRRWLKRRLQGFTGDCLGATQQFCELAFYLGLACGLNFTL